MSIKAMLNARREAALVEVKAKLSTEINNVLEIDNRIATHGEAGKESAPSLFRAMTKLVAAAHENGVEAIAFAEGVGDSLNLKSPTGRQYKGLAVALAIKAEEKAADEGEDFDVAEWLDHLVVKDAREIAKELDGKTPDNELNESISMLRRMRSRGDAATQARANELIANIRKAFGTAVTADGKPLVLKAARGSKKDDASGNSGTPSTTVPAEGSTDTEVSQRSVA